MTAQLIVDNITVPIKKIKFSDGGTSIKLEVPEYLKKYPPSAYYSISVDPETPVDDYLWEIALVNSAIEETWGWDKFNRSILKLPYLPHGRADRVFEEGNPAPLKVFLECMENCFDEVFLTDPHSDYYLNWKCEINFTVTHQHQCFLETVKGVQSGDALVAPDKGALSKIYKLQQTLDVRTIATFVVEAGKKRDIETGRVVETTLPVFDYSGKTFYIVDDLCDGAGSFIPLAKKLKELGAKEVNLYVTHGIFAKGLDILREYIDNIHCYQVIGKYVTMKEIQQFNEGV
jgi:ribose-phosphate pyrophosphokinase